MKTVSVIGATGFVGPHVVDELVNRGYTVRAIARDVSKVKKADHVSGIAADVNDTAQLSKAIAGSDAVISTFNPGWTNPNIYNDFLKGIRSIEQAVEASGVKRFIVVGGAGSLYGPDNTQLVDGPGFPEAFKAGALAARDYLNEISKNTTLDWTFFSPAIEMHQGTAGVRRGTYRTSLNTPVFDQNGRSILSVEDVGVALADELEQNKFVRKRFTAAY